MSLAPDDSRRRGRSKSPGRRDERDRSRSRVDDIRERSTSRLAIESAPQPPSFRYEDARYEDDRDRDRRRYDYREDEYTTASRAPAREDPRYYRDVSPARKPEYAVPGEYKEDVKPRYDDRNEDQYYDKGKYYRQDYSSDESSERRTRQAEEYLRRNSQLRDKDSKTADYRRYDEEDDARDRGFHAKASGSIDLGPGSGYPAFMEPDPAGRGGPAYGGRPTSPPSIQNSYAEVKKWEYAQPQEKITFVRKDSQSVYGPSPRSSQSQVYGVPPTTSQGRVVTVEPGQRRPSNVGGLAPGMAGLAIAAGHHSLQIAGGHRPSTSLANAPGSPLLESYRGTYQSVSPMPSPIMGASQSFSSNSDILDIGSLVSTRHKHARFHDPADDAARIAKALKGNKEPDTDPLIDILPALTHEQVMELRVEYKKLVKTGSERKGVNIAKHIKLRLKEESPSLMKACYTVALGRWESEAYWANFWYQGEKSRRELLIESLMGRTNAEIRAIKDGFSDKKYSDSLTKCMKQELKEDKFKKAVLLVLEEKRMEDRPGYPIDRILVEEDVRMLHKCIRSEKGGETAMIEIIVRRSDNHIREILRLYELTYHANFARDMLKKSGNLVGEMLAHILNGVINRPVRDAILLHHALSLTKSDGLRTELLISRLVRYHWDGLHMEAVKREYRTRYKKDLQHAIRDGTKGSWGEFCEELCIRRMPDDVRRVERVQIVSGSSYH